MASSKIETNTTKYKETDMIHNFKQYVRVWLNSREWLFIALLKRIPSRRIRIALLRCKGANIANDVAMFASIEIRNPEGLVIGNGCSIGPKVLLDARKGLKIGHSVTIAYDAIIWTLHHDMNASDFRTIGANTTILPNVKIGDNVIISAGSVITKDIPSNSVVGGVPAKKIMSFEEYIEKRRKKEEEIIEYDGTKEKEEEIWKLFESQRTEKI